jgi:hypothetical protein
MSVVLRAAVGTPKVWNQLWNADTTISNTYGWQNYVIRNQIDMGGFTGIRNGNAVRLTFKAGISYVWGVANVFIGNNTRGSPNFTATPTRITFNGGQFGFVLNPNQTITSDPINFVFDPGRSLLVSIDADNTSPGGLPYNSSGTTPYSTMWYAGGPADASNLNMKSSNGPYVGYNYGGLFMIEVLGQPVDTWFPGPLDDEPQTFSDYTIRMLIPQSVLPQSGGDRIRLSFSPYLSTGGYGMTITDMRIGRADPSWSRTNPAFRDTPQQVTFNGGNTFLDLFALGPSSISSDVINLSMPQRDGLCLSAYCTNAGPIATGYLAGGRYQPYGGGTCYKAGNDAATVAAAGYTVSAYNFMSWLYNRIEAVSSSPPFNTSYSGRGGKGNRSATGIVVPSTSFPISATYPLSSLVDGGSWSGIGPLTSAVQSSGYWMFDFGQQVYIDEIAWYIGAAVAPETFAVEGSNDTVNWDRVSTVNLGNVTPRKIAAFVPLVSNRYRYYRLRLIEGVTQVSYYNWEAEFRIDPPVTFDQSNKLLLHFDGVDGARNVQDASPSTHPLTFVGSQTRITTGASKFGVSSLQAGTGASQGGHVTTPYSADFDFGVNDDFTVEAWINMTALPNPYGVIVGGDSVGWFVGMWPSPNWLTIWTAAVGYYYLGWPASVDGGTPQLNTWYHVAVSRYGSMILGFVNGQLCPTRAATQYDFSLGAGHLLWIGGLTTYNFIGYIDELCIRKGFAYTTPFSPPTQAYLPTAPVSGPTDLSARLGGAGSLSVNATGGTGGAQP